MRFLAFFVLVSRENQDSVTCGSYEILLSSYISLA